MAVVSDSGMGLAHYTGQMMGSKPKESEQDCQKKQLITMNVKKENR
jgi:hypothetical protein